jgi:hypothetical protein
LGLGELLYFNGHQNPSCPFLHETHGKNKLDVKVPKERRTAIRKPVSKAFANCYEKIGINPLMWKPSIYVFFFTLVHELKSRGYVDQSTSVG